MPFTAMKFTLLQAPPTTLPKPSSPDSFLVSSRLLFFLVPSSYYQSGISAQNLVFARHFSRAVSSSVMHLARSWLRVS